jgi:hypothetical protein
MSQNRPEHGQRQLPAVVDPMWRWPGSIGLAIVVGIAYLLAARLSLVLLTTPGGVAVFWPASGVAAGALIALGHRAQLPVAVGAMVGTIAAALLGRPKSHWLPGRRTMQRGGSPDHSGPDRALFRFAFQP